MNNLSLVTGFFYMTHQPGGQSDSGGRWYPSSIEKCDCCNSIRTPSRSYPWSMFKHCCSKKHIKNLILKAPTHLSENIPTALAMTKETAPLYINTDSELLKYMRDVILGVRKKLNHTNKEKIRAY